MSDPAEHTEPVQHHPQPQQDTPEMRAFKAKRRKARELIIRVKLYRLLAVLLAVLGLLIFASLYYEYIQADLMAALTDPKTVMFVLVPFLPAAIIAWIARGEEKKLTKTIEDLGGRHPE